MSSSVPTFRPPQPLTETVPIPLTDPGLPVPTSTSSYWHRAPSSFLHSHRTTPTLPASVKTLIIGSGISGTFFLRHLCSLSPTSASDTLLLEARNTCWGATGRNGGHCKPMVYQFGFFEELIAEFGEEETLKRVRFELLNYQTVKSYIEENGVTEADWAEGESTDVYFEPHLFSVAKRCVERLKGMDKSLADRCRVVEDRKELAGLRVPEAVGAIRFTAASLWPYKVVSHILEKAVKEGRVNLQTLTPVRSIQRDAESGRWEVETPRGTVKAERVVFATNAHTAHLLPVFRGWIFPVRGQMSAIVPPRTLQERPLECTYALVRGDRKKADYLIQRPRGGEILVGGGRYLEENSGIGLDDATVSDKVARYLSSALKGYFTAEEGWESNDEEMEGGLRKSFMNRFRELRVSSSGHSVWDAAEGLGVGGDEVADGETGEHEPRETHKWSGVMGYSADERPFVGKVPAVHQADAEARGIQKMEDTTGLWMLAGFEGHGMALTSGSAKALALMMQAGKDSVEDTGVYEWFPRSFEVTPERLRLESQERGGEWVVVDKQTEADRT